MQSIETWLNNLSSEKKSYALSEIVQHLKKSEKEIIAQNLLLNFVFVEEKIKMISPIAIISDYDLILKNVSEETEVLMSLKALMMAIQQCSHLLENNRNQVASQLIGYLYGKKTIYINKFLESAKKSNSTVWLNPITPSLSNQQGEFIKAFTGQSNSISCIEVTKDKKQVISGCDEGIIKIWDIKSSIALQTLKDEFIDGKVVVIKKIYEKYILALYNGNNQTVLKIWDIKSQSLLNRVIGKNEEVIPHIEIIGNEKYAITVGLNNNKELIIWNIPLLEPHQVLTYKEKVDSFSCISSPKIGRKGLLSFFNRKKSNIHFTLKLISVCSKADIIIQEFFDNQFWKVKKFKNNVEGLQIISKKGTNQIIMWSYSDIKVVDFKTGDVLYYIFALDNEYFTNVIATAYDDIVIVFKSDGAIKLRNLETGEYANLHTVDINSEQKLDPNNTVHTEVFTLKNSNIAFSCSNKGELKIWDLKKVKIINEFTNWDMNNICVLNEKELLSSDYSAINLWNIGNVSKPKNTLNHDGEVSDIKYFKKKEFLISTSYDNTIKIINPKNLKSVIALKAHTTQVNNSEIFLRNNKYYLLSVSGYFQFQGNELRIWDLETNKSIKSIKSHEKEIKRAQVIRQGYYAIAMDIDFTVKLVDLVTDEDVFTFDHTPKLEIIQKHLLFEVDKKKDIYLKISPGVLFPYFNFEIYNRERNLIIGYFDGTVLIWDLKEQYLETKLNAHKEAVTEITINKNGDMVLTASLDETFKLWDLKDYSCLREFNENIGVINKLIFLSIPFKYKDDLESFDENVIESHQKGEEAYFLTATSEAVLKMWSVKTGKCLIDFIGHTENIIFLIPFTKTRRVLSICAFGNLIIWNLLNGKQITSLAIGRSISSATLANNEQMIVLGEQNGQINFIKIEDNQIPQMIIVV